MATVIFDGAATTPSNSQSTERWLKQLLARLPGAVENVVLGDLTAAFIEFYRESRAWRVTELGPYSVTAGRDTVFLNPADQYSRVVYVFDAFLNFGAGDVRSLTLQTSMPQFQEASTPTMAFCEEPAVLRLYPEPDADLGRVLYVNAALVPAEDLIRIPPLALTHHYDAILDGALARCYAMPNKPYTSPELAGFHDRRFRKSIARWRDVADRGYSSASLPWRFPAFA